MTKREKIKICREFMGGKRIGDFMHDDWLAAAGLYEVAIKVQKAICWGLKNPKELKKKKK